MNFLENISPGNRAERLKKAAEEAKLGRTKAEAELARIKAENEAQMAKAAQTGNLQAADAQRGISFAKETLGFGEGTLGRLDSGAQQGIADRFRDLSQGMSAEELQANRDKAGEQINRSTQTMNRQLQGLQQRQGIRGATAASQQLGILSQGEDRKADFERDLFLKDRGARMEGLQNLRQAEADLQQINKFNLAQAAQERYDLAQSGLSFMQMGQAERAAEKAAEAQRAAAAARSGGCFAPDTLIRMEDGTLKPICLITIGERLFLGGTVYSMLSFANGEDTYSFRDTLVTGSHAVLYEGKWKRVQDTGVEKVARVPFVCSLSCENHRIVTEDEAIFADYDEVDNGSEFNNTESLRKLNECA